MHELFHYVGAHHPSTAAQVVLPSHVHSFPGPCSPQNTENPSTSGLQKYFLYIAEQPEIRPVIKTLCSYEHIRQTNKTKPKPTDRPTNQLQGRSLPWQGDTAQSRIL